MWPTATAVGKKTIRNCFLSPGRGERLFSSNYKARVKLNPMFLEQCYDLFLICQLSVRACPLGW